MCVSLQVDVSKLERMELSSIPITEIWNYHHSNRSLFKNLTHLDVNGCWKLEHLISFSMAKCLGSLQSLFVSECGNMKGIFPDSMQMEVSRLVGLYFHLVIFMFEYYVSILDLKCRFSKS